MLKFKNSLPYHVSVYILVEIFEPGETITKECLKIVQTQLEHSNSRKVFEKIFLHAINVALYKQSKQSTEHVLI